MKVRAQPRPQTLEQARVELSRRLEARREEIEAAVMTRVYSVSDTTDLDPSYAEGLKAAVTAAVDYGFAAVELGEERTPPTPPILLAQARLAARAGVSLDTVLRRYFAGHALLGDFLVEEAEGGRLLRGAALQRLLRTQATLFDRLLAAVSEEHIRESRQRPTSSERRRAERIERLLAGEMIDTSGLGYEFEASHLAIVARDARAREAIRKVASAFDRRVLSVRREDGTLWAWLGGGHELDPGELKHRLSAQLPHGTAAAVGEPGAGLPGWRLSHHQANAALPISVRGSEALVRYSEVALLASILQDDLLATSLRRLYLKPIEAEGGGKGTLFETLRAYIAAERNTSSAAAALGVNRNTVTSRLRTIETTIGRPLASCGPELDVTLRLAELSDTCGSSGAWQVAGSSSSG